MANNDDQIQLDLNQDQAGQVVKNVPAGAQTTLAFRVEQSKIPDFWGQKAKDTVTAIVFIRKIEDFKDQQLERHHHLRKCGQRLQRVRSGLALCHGRHAGLDRGTTHLDQSEAEVPKTIRDADG